MVFGLSLTCPYGQAGQHRCSFEVEKATLQQAQWVMVGPVSAHRDCHAELLGMGADSAHSAGYRAPLLCFRALFTYEGNSNDIRVAGTGGE